MIREGRWLMRMLLTLECHIRMGQEDIRTSTAMHMSRRAGTLTERIGMESAKPDFDLGIELAELRLLHLADSALPMRATIS